MFRGSVFVSFGAARSKAKVTRVSYAAFVACGLPYTVCFTRAGVIKWFFRHAGNLHPHTGSV